MLVKMLQTRRVSEDGFVCRLLEKGQTYDLAHTAACAVLNAGWAYNVEPEDDRSPSDIVIDAIRKAGGKAVELPTHTKPKSQLEVLSEMFDILFGVHEKRVPTNPNTYQQKGESL